MTPEQAQAYCDQGIHVRDPEGHCLECGDDAFWTEAHAELEAHEPPRGAVVMTEGAQGTAWQRFNSDGRWHSTTGKSTAWKRLILADRPAAPLRIIYLPPPA